MNSQVKKAGFPPAKDRSRPLRACCIVAVVLSVLCGSLGGEEFTLTIDKASHSSVYPIGSEFLDMARGDKGWTNGGEFLTARSKTAKLVFNPGDGDLVYLFVAIDILAKGRKKPDVLYIDLDEDRILDEGERFPFREIDTGEGKPEYAGFLLCAEKVPFVRGLVGEEPSTFVNIYYLTLANDPSGSDVIFGLASWVCRQGQVSLDGKIYEARIDDYNLNGSYDDFQDRVGGPADWLTLIPHGEKRAAAVVDQPLSLFQRIILESRAWSLAVRENGRILAVDPIPVDFGAIKVSQPDVELIVNSKAWGEYSIAPGKAKRLPVGDWEILGFKRRRDDPFPMCLYGSPSAKILNVSREETTTVTLATDFRARVTARSSPDMIDLSLELSTADGASFRGYYPNESTVDGVPFSISDGSGKVVEEGIFYLG